MKIVAFLQNQWFKDPDKARQVFARNPEHRERLIASYLFMSCLTGKRLQAVFGEELCDSIVWEEANAEVGSYSGSLFMADRRHMMSVIEKHKPDVVLSFGKIASAGIESLPPVIKKEVSVIYGPHPAARSGAVERLRKMKSELEAFALASEQQ